MSFSQTKLSKAEWVSTEIPASDEEKEIYKLIKEGFHNVSLSYNTSQCLEDFLKTEDSELMKTYIYELYLADKINKLCIKYSISPPEYQILNIKKIKKADKIRIEHSQDKISQKKDNIIEFILLNYVSQLVKYYKDGKKKWLKQYYTLSILHKYNFKNINFIFYNWIENILKKYNPIISNELYEQFLENIKDNIESNEVILKYKNKELYEHQKQLFSLFNASDSFEKSNLVFYCAPTGTGKTLSPIGLSEKYKIVFVCAARHVGLSLAKVAVNIGKKIAFAFGCSQMEDIRLHYFAAKEFDVFRNGRKKVNNMVGDNVEIMICDIASFEIAMLYMKAFHPLEETILYWDEPTISLDYETHPLHDIIKHNWETNLIPNIVLSSATLPMTKDIPNTITSFNCKFENTQHTTISTSDYFKTICILSKDGKKAVPHKLFENYNDILNCVEHLNNHKTLLRYLDLEECSKFIIYVNEHIIMHTNKKQLYLCNYFQNLSEINILNVKQYYLLLLKNISNKNWNIVYQHFMNDKPIPCDAYIATTSAFTLTHGPTIYISNEIDKLAKFCVQTSKIPKSVLETISSNIEYNQNILDIIKKKEKDLEDGIQKDAENEKKIADNRISVDMKALQHEITQLQKQLKNIMLNDAYIPNRASHFEKWAPSDFVFTKSKVFTSCMDEEIVEKIMLLENVEPIWKLLLLMGIGALKLENDPMYNEIMKELAQKQQLYLIIASSDYIYGTNYQFCHSYIGKDLGNMSQEKLIQALGRVGRQNIQHNYTIRFRNDEVLHKLFLPDTEFPEVKNMNKLFV
tara:strand:+ start:778 stop:3183 length:2406 start_codon:yes stop_codon:yes gene_type:complete